MAVSVGARQGRAPQPLHPLVARPGRHDLDAADLSGRRGEIDELERDVISRYLRDCPLFLAWMEHTRDVLDRQFETSGGSGIQSDGVFYWRVDAADYVLAYGVGLPVAFLQGARARAWVVPTFTSEQYLELFELLLEEEDVRGRGA